MQDRKKQLTFDFDTAIEKLRIGKKLTRVGWDHSEESYVFIRRHGDLIKMFLVRPVDGDKEHSQLINCDFKFSFTDVLSFDWKEV